MAAADGLITDGLGGRYLVTEGLTPGDALVPIGTLGAVGGPLTPPAYWLYVPVAGRYLLAVDDELLAVEPTGLPEGGMVVDCPAAGLFSVAVLARRSGGPAAYVSAYHGP